MIQHIIKNLSKHVNDDQFQNDVIRPLIKLFVREIRYYCGIMMLANILVLLVFMIIILKIAH